MCRSEEIVGIKVLLMVVKISNVTMIILIECPYHSSLLLFFTILVPTVECIYFLYSYDKKLWPSLAVRLLNKIKEKKK